MMCLWQTQNKPQKRRRTRVRSRHTGAIQLDHSKRPALGPPDEKVAQRLTELIHPATLSQLDNYRHLGLRQRVLALPVMVALVISMIWREIGSGYELVRVLQAEGFLWTSPMEVTQQAVSERLRTFPAKLFLRALLEILSLSEDLGWAQAHYAAVLAVGGST